MNKRALVMYARPPILGQVKTRLQPVFTPVEALALYEAMLADGVERLARLGTDLGTPFLSWSAPFEPTGPLAALLEKVNVETQSAGDLGERMAITIQGKLRAGYNHVVIIGSDTPNLPSGFLIQAFEALLEADTVIGPSTDGGYYLIGCRRLHPGLFRRMPWGTSKILSATRRRIKQEGITCRELPPWYDVDRPDDAARLWRDLQAAKVGGIDLMTDRTRRTLSRLVPGRL